MHLSKVHGLMKHNQLVKALSFGFALKNWLGNIGNYKITHISKLYQPKSRNEREPCRRPVWRR